MQKKKNRIFSKIIAFALMCMCFLTSFQIKPRNANAVTVTGYTGVLSDLMIDDNFDKNNYPSNAEDYSVDIIQIAESTGGELFIYLYQPSAKEKQFTFTTISLSQAINDNAKWNLYELKLIDSDGVFAKYKVKNITLKSDVLRYYDITMIHRKFDSDIDEQPSNGNTTTEIACNISQQWSVVTLNGETYYECVETETIVITEKYVGFIQYESGFQFSDLFFYDEACHSHFVAFSTDHEIDKLFEADISYISQTRIYNDFNDDVTFGSAKTNNVTLKYTDKVEYETGFITKKNKYTWDRIQSVNDFIDNVGECEAFEKSAINIVDKVELKDSTKEKIQEMQWVLRFAETDFKTTEKTAGLPTLTTNIKYNEFTETAVTDVVILRLKFETDGVVYNLGVVDNKTNGTGIPDNYIGWFDGVSDEIKQVLKIIGIILLVILVAVGLSLLAVFTPFFKWVGKGLIALFKGIWWVITAPIAVFKDDDKE